MLSDADNYAIVAAQLIEAACRTREGDSKSAKALIARAVALLGGDPTAIPTGVRAPNRQAPEAFRGGLAAWQKRRLVAYIDSHIAGKIRTEALARLLNLSQGHFCRTFRSAFGTSPHDYLTRRRIELAQGLMLTTHEPLSEVALRCGLSDQSHFTRMFRRIVGETPFAWRRSRWGEIGNARPSARSLQPPDQGYMSCPTPAASSTRQLGSPAADFR